MKRIGIFGTSGFAREVDDVAGELGFEPIFVARGAAEREAWPHAEEVVLEDDVLRLADMPFAIGIGDNAIRQRLAERYASRLGFVNLVHPSATFGRRQRAGLDRCRGVVVCAGARFMNNVQVGDFTIFNLNATVGHDSVIESFAHVTPGTNISGNVHVATRVWIGTGAAINQGLPGKRLTIGADTVIASGAVVIADCDPGSIYAGVPARKIR